jgi:hypothetical protein
MTVEAIADKHGHRTGRDRVEPAVNGEDLLLLACGGADRFCTLHPRVGACWLWQSGKTATAQYCLGTVMTLR